MFAIMLCSMTGYGERSQKKENTLLRVTIQSLNSRNLDIKINAPQLFAGQMLDWHRTIAHKLKQGRIDVNIFYNRVAATAYPAIQKDNIKECYALLEEIATELGAKTDLLALTIRLLSAKQEKVLIEKKEQALINEMIEGALADCIISRKAEGKNLQKQIIDCLLVLEEGIIKINDYLPLRMENLRDRLKEKIQTREGTIDENRWEQEVLYYLEKMDIEEENARLKSHIDYFRNTIRKEARAATKLSFIVQEMLREVNTIGAKAQDVFLQHLVVSMKQSLTQMKEQLRNVL